jgi:hypothetical protein
MLEDERDPIFEELNRQTDRGAAIIGAALLDTLLEEALLMSFLRISSRIRDDLFGSYKPLAPFAAKINVGFAIGLLTTHLHHDLMLVRQIRNKFAHHVEPLEFGNPDIGPLCQRLETKKLSGVKVPSNRNAFLVTVELIAAAIKLQSSTHLLGKDLRLTALNDLGLETASLIEGLACKLRTIQRRKE